MTVARRFVLVRDDHDAVNPPGIVAEGVLFSTNHVVLHWLTKPYSTQVFDNLSDVLAVQQRNHISRIQWVDTEHGQQVQPRSGGAQRLAQAQEQLTVFLSRSNSGIHAAVSDDILGVSVTQERKPPR